MAVVGTIFNALTIGGSLYACGLTGIYGEDYPGILETLLFSSLISAVDPVTILRSLIYYIFFHNLFFGQRPLVPLLLLSPPC
jgi:hypothetical protein